MTNTPPSKLYIAVRADLAPGAQLAQSTHAAFQFSDEWPLLMRGWMQGSNNLVVVAVPNELALAHLATRAVEEGIARTVVREPDFDNTITAVALEPGEVARRLCAQMSCALKISPCTEVFLDTDGYNSIRIREGGVHA